MPRGPYLPSFGNCGSDREWNASFKTLPLVYDPQGAKPAYMSGQTLQKYMLPLAGGVQAVFNSSGLQYNRHADWLGTSRLALDVNGNLYSSYSYAPFGETYAGTGPANRSFTGQSQDVIVGQLADYDFLFNPNRIPFAGFSRFQALFLDVRSWFSSVVDFYNYYYQSLWQNRPLILIEMLMYIGVVVKYN